MQHKFRSLQIILMMLYLLFAGHDMQIAWTASHTIKVIVNGQVITERDWQRRTALLSALHGEGPAHQNTKEQALQMLIDEKLIAQDARRKKIEVDKEDIEQAWASIAERNNMSVPVLKQQMQNSGIDVEEFEEQLKSQSLQAKILRLVIEPQVMMSELEIQEWLQAGHNLPGGVDQGEVQRSALQKKLLLKMRSYIQGLRRKAYIDMK